MSQDDALSDQLGLNLDTFGNEENRRADEDLSLPSLTNDLQTMVADFFTRLDTFALHEASTTARNLASSVPPAAPPAVPSSRTADKEECKLGDIVYSKLVNGMEVERITIKAAIRKQWNLSHLKQEVKNVIYHNFDEIMNPFMWGADKKKAGEYKEVLQKKDKGHVNQWWVNFTYEEDSKTKTQLMAVFCDKSLALYAKAYVEMHRARFEEYLKNKSTKTHVQSLILDELGLIDSYKAVKGSMQSADAVLVTPAGAAATLPLPLPPAATLPQPLLPDAAAIPEEFLEASCSNCQRTQILQPLRYKFKTCVHPLCSTVLCTECSKNTPYAFWACEDHKEIRCDTCNVVVKFKGQRVRESIEVENTFTLCSQCTAKFFPNLSLQS